MSDRKMILCSLCQSIPFQDLPQLSPTWICSLSGDPERNQFYIREEPPEGPLGFPHQPNLEALITSAATCGLCDLINEGVGGFTTAYRTAQQDPYFQQNDRNGFPVSFELWLTRRIGSGDGLLAFVYAPSGRSIYLVGAVGFCVEDESPLASVIRGRIVDEEASTERTLSQAATWVRNCVEKHAHCSTTIGPLPSRLLDLEGSSSPDIIKLWATEGTEGHYATLSHCWGTAGHYTTSRASMAARIEGIRLQELPRTFQDAIVVTRRVGIRYLWIDSLCICQDDVEDWDRESANMAAIYSNAYLTIAATSAKDNTAGCFIRRPERRNFPIDFTTKDGKSGQLLAFRLPLEKAALSWRYVEMRDQALTKRAWALQERLMAHRILHYCVEQMRYECNEEFLTEDGIYEEGRFNSLFESPIPSNGIPESRTGHTVNHALWYRLLWDYTSRRLTKPSDKLPALSGLARLFAERLNTDYVAGLWGNALIEGLAWQGLQERGEDGHKTSSSWSLTAAGSVAGPAVYVAPSWSWASFRGIAATGQHENWKDVAAVLGFHMDLKSANPFGEVQGGWIRLRAPLVRLSLSDVAETSEEKTRRALMRLKTASGNPFGRPASFDHIYHRSEGARALVASLELFGLVLREMETDDEKAGGSEKTYYVMIVAKDGNDSARMRRMGWVFLDNDLIGDLELIEDPKKKWGEL